jgi:hypothetical protein
MSTASEQRQALIDLTTLAKRDLFALWQSLQGLGATETRDALAALLPSIGDAYGAAAAALAADWFDELRETEGVKGRFLAEPAPDVDQARWDSLAGWGVDPLFGPNPDWAAALTLISGGLQRTIADRHRLTIVDNSIRDPRASGWKRVGVGDNCGFCRMLIDRGHVYTEAGVTFRSHDHCNCAASPSWSDKFVQVSREPYRQSQRNRSDETKAKDNARAREFIADNYGA